MRAIKLSRNSVLLLESSRSLQYSLGVRQGIKKLQTAVHYARKHSTQREGMKPCRLLDAIRCSMHESNKTPAAENYMWPGPSQASQGIGDFISVRELGLMMRLDKTSTCKADLRLLFSFCNVTFILFQFICETQTCSTTRIRTQNRTDASSVFWVD